MRLNAMKTCLISAAMALFALPALAAEIEVKMLNKGSDGLPMVFEPAGIKAQVGDVIRFVPTDKSHDAAAVPNLLPEGVAPFKGKLNKELVVTVEKPGAYVIKCTPHLAMGMIAIIVVGDEVPANIDAVKTAKFPKKARERLDAEIVKLGL